MQKQKGKTGLYEDGNRRQGEERKGEEVHSQKRWRQGEKESGIYFHLSTALKAINTYKAPAFRALGQYWSVRVCVCV